MKKEVNPKRAKVLSIIASITLVLFITEASVAWFLVGNGDDVMQNTRVTTGSTDSLVFRFDDVVELSATPSNFNQTTGSISTTAKGYATLKSASTTTANYNVYFVVGTNNFSYSIDRNSPELILSITDPSGNEVTTLDGFNYVTKTDNKGDTIKGFDITTYRGIITLGNNYEIKTTSNGETITQEWTIKVTFVNYNANQMDNRGKTLKAKLYFSGEEGDFDLCEKYPEIATCLVKALYVRQGENDLYYHNGTITSTSVGIDNENTVLDAEDKSYRYAGTNPNNYVCFGSDAATCPEDNLYRIIGYFDLNGDGMYYAKLIKATSYGNLAWDDSTNVSQYGSNTWGTSKLKSTLNGAYLTGLGNWSNYIYNATWSVGGHNFWNYLSGNVTPKASYGNEILNPTGGTNNPTDGKMTDTFKIGLMYINDYAYAALPQHWNTVLYTETSGVSDYRAAAAATDWIFQNFSGQYQWMISRNGETFHRVCYVHSTGHMRSDRSAYNVNVVRPSFYLNLNTNINTNHMGSATDPYRIDGEANYDYQKYCDKNMLSCVVANEWTDNSGSTAKVYYHNGTITGTTAGIDSTTDILDAEDLSYRYAGASENVNNYVCFGSDTKDCPEGNLYRIIGAFTFDNGSTYNVKLIKNTAYTTDKWDTSNSNTWMRPATIRTSLNGAFLTTLGDWVSLIYQPMWYVGGVADNGKPSKTIYDEEMAANGGTNKPTTGDTDASGAYIDNESKIGLMYVSDYTYATKPSYWKTNVSSYSSAKDYDWLLYVNGTATRQWTISRLSGNTDLVRSVFNDGNVSYYSANYSNVVRPSFYLNSNVTISGGSGTSSNPWKINL